MGVNNLVQHFTNDEEMVELIVTGNVTRSYIDRCFAKADVIIAERKKQREIANEQRRQIETAQSIPEIRYPKLWNVRKAGSNYLDELNEYIASRDIAELEVYLAGLQNGACASEDFKNNSGFEASAYLSAAIRRRKAAGGSTGTFPSQADIEKLSAKAEDLAKTQKELDKKFDQMSATQSDAKTKAYTA